MASTLSTATLPTTRRRQDSSDDFGDGSLGSIGGSAVGSSVEEEKSSHRRPQETQSTFAAGAAVVPAAVGHVATVPIPAPVPHVSIVPVVTSPKRGGGGEEHSSASKGSGGPHSTTSKRPAIKRKGSVDFSLSIDDEVSAGPLKKRKPSVDFTLAIDDDHTEGEMFSRVLPKLDSLPSMEAMSNASPLIRGSASVGSSQTQGQTILALDHLDALGEEAGAAAAKLQRFKPRAQSMDSTGSNGTFTSNSQRMLLEAFMSYGGPESSSSSYARRDRLESWGGMSDLSVTGIDNMSHSFVNSDSTTAAALASLADDVAAAANFENDSLSSLLAGDDSKVGSIPSKICVDSVAESDPSAALLQVTAETDFLSSDLQAFVKAAMASVGTQLAELATAVESAANADASETHTKDPEADNSDMSSVISLMIGATSDAGSKVGSLESRPHSLSVTSALKISVDYDAVAAAVSAAEAASGELDLSALVDSFSIPKSGASVSSAGSKSMRRRQHLPTKNKRKNSDATASSVGSKKVISGPLHINFSPIPKPKTDERDMEEIRERARAAAGYVPPSSPSDVKARPLPPKKRTKRLIPDPQTPDQRAAANDTFTTPRTSNLGAAKTPASAAYLSSATSPSTSVKASAAKGQSGQKWDSMFDALVAFIAERKEEETIDMSDKDKQEWAWDGNVPTTFKSKDGKALGRWVNNQRSAKSKGVLKDDREDRLVKAGLKWSVLASNSWNEMLEELRLYVNEQTKAGRKWDGNVPTNYRIKTKLGSKLSDEDKNLGRWVNRQRSLYQAGKLRKDRQLALEKVGLKWSMLATTSWESMFDTLCDYVKTKTADGAEWDGNVPANYRTNDNPPRALGRWINRQRSAYVKDKLKVEYVEKLNSIGLKWSVHERRSLTGDLMTSSDAGRRDDDSCDGEDDYDYECSSVGQQEEDLVPDRQLSNTATVPDIQLSSIDTASGAAQKTPPVSLVESKSALKNKPVTKQASSAKTTIEAATTAKPRDTSNDAGEVSATDESKNTTSKVSVTTVDSSSISNDKGEAAAICESESTSQTKNSQTTTEESKSTSKVNGDPVQTVEAKSTLKDNVVLPTPVESQSTTKDEGEPAATVDSTKIDPTTPVEPKTTSNDNVEHATTESSKSTSKDKDVPATTVE